MKVRTSKDTFVWGAIDHTNSNTQVAIDPDRGFSVSNNTIFFSTGIWETTILKLNHELDVLSKKLLATSVAYDIEPIPIKLHINSGGGSVFEGISAQDNILNCRVPVHTVIDGVVASAATFLSLAGTKRSMYRNAWFMIHQIRGGNWGTYTQLNDQKINFDQFMDQLKALYKERSNVPVDKLDEILEHDIFWDAETCLEYGLIDEIIG